MSPRYGIAIDLKRCIACHSCAIACKTENGTPPGVYWSKVLTKEEGRYPGTKMIFLPLLCMHCQSAPCAEVCPTGATKIREDGIVVVDYEKCMGCRYCEAACPYDARQYVKEIKPYQPDGIFTPYEDVMYSKHATGIVEKCTMCSHRIDQGLEPACVATCSSAARYFGDLNDMNGDFVKTIARKGGRQLNAHLGTNPSVYYIGG